MATYPADAMIQAQRLLVIDEIQRYLSSLPHSIEDETGEQIAVYVGEIQALQAKLVQFVQLGDAMAHALYTNLGDAILKLQAAIQKTTHKAPLLKEIFATDWHTLQIIAEDELGAQAKWPGILEVNEIQYSTDLLDLVTVKLS